MTEQNGSSLPTKEKINEYDKYKSDLSMLSDKVLDSLYKRIIHDGASGDRKKLELVVQEMVKREQARKNADSDAILKTLNSARTSDDRPYNVAMTPFDGPMLEMVGAINKAFDGVAENKAFDGVADKDGGIGGKK